MVGFVLVLGSPEGAKLGTVLVLGWPEGIARVESILA